MKRLIPLLLLAVLILSGCGSSKKVTYMQDLNARGTASDDLEQIPQTVETRVMPGDLLDITLTGFNVEALKPFNRTSQLMEVDGGSGSNMRTTNAGNSTVYYLVDENGYIEFPVVGRIHVGGMTKAQVVEAIASAVYPRYLSERPSVDVRFRNFRVSVLGEVKSPGVYRADNERMTLFEALATAGDLLISGRRDNVMLVRTDGDGKKHIHRLNLNDKNIVLSPYYNLQQNDVIYVEPNSARAQQSFTIPPALTLTLSSVGTLISITTLILTITKK